MYGKLYNGYAAARNLCPQFWDVPTQDEWQALSEAFGGNATSGGALKESGLGHWQSPNAGATNESGFTAASFSDLTLSAVFWAKPSYVPQANTTRRPRTPRLTATSTVLEFPSHSVRRGHSVRCLRSLRTSPAPIMEYDPAANVDDGGHAGHCGLADDRYARIPPRIWTTPATDPN